MAFSTALGVASTGLNVVGNVLKGNSDRKRARAIAKILREQAFQERLRGEAQLRDFSRGASRFVADREAAAGGTGIRQDTGSAASVADDILAEIEVQKFRMQKNTDLRVKRLLQSAESVRSAGNRAFTEGLVRGGSSLLTGLSQVDFSGGGGGGLNLNQQFVSSNPLAPSNR